MAIDAEVVDRMELIMNLAGVSIVKEESILTRDIVSVKLAHSGSLDGADL